MLSGNLWPGCVFLAVVSNVSEADGPWLLEADLRLHCPFNLKLIEPCFLARRGADVLVADSESERRP